MLQNSNNGPFGAPRRSTERRAAAPIWKRDSLLPTGWSRRTQFAVTWLMLVAVTSTFIWSSTWIRPVKPVGLALIGAGYQHNLVVTHNVGGWQSLQDLAALARNSDAARSWGSGLLSLEHDPVDFYHCQGWDASLDQVTERNVLVYFSVHGGADTQGPFLLPASTKLQSTPYPLLRMNDVLDRLARLPADRQKILVLDTTTMTACPPLGMLTNDFARGLIELNPRIAEIPNLVVICASDIGQRSWFCEEWRQSIFGHFVLEGFKGAARDLNDDGRINLAEFFAYVSGSVERWVQSNRESSQCPILLPTGEPGLERAQRIDLALECRDYRPPDARDTPIFEPPQQLVDNWDLHDRMAAEVPAPWVYTPHLWRRYQDLLLRYEELVRIHDSACATVINDQLSELALEIAQTRRLSLSCLQNSLAMPLAAGWSRILDGRIAANGTDAPIDPTAVFNELWRSSPTDLMPRWSAIRAKLSGNIIAQQTLLFFLREQILKRAADDFATHGKKAAELVSSLDDPLSIRPAEVHFLVMLGRDLPQPCPRNLSDLVRTALQVRKIAERAALGVESDAHPYSEEVTCWTHEIIAAADQRRRAGEDRLFADSSNWALARHDFEHAKAWYQQAQEASLGLARACSVRDRLAAMLPYYSTWLARRTARDAVARDRDEALFDQIEKLWHDQHELTARLNQPIILKPASAQSAADDHSATNDSPSKATPEITAIVQCSSAAAESFAALEQSLVESLRELVDVDLPSVWRDTNDALSVPYCDSSLRMKLLANKRRMSRRLLIETSNTTEVVSVTPQPVNVVDLKYRAARYGRLSLALLGSAWFDKCPGEELETSAQVEHRLNLFAVENQWWNSVARAGWQIGRRWQETGATITAEFNRCQSDVPNAFRHLQIADNLNRQLSGAVKNALASEPGQIFRDRRMARLLRSQSERTWQDHWFAEDPNAEPYYRRAAMAYLNDAQQLGLPPTAGIDLRQKIVGPGELAFDLLPRQQLTTEQRFSLPFCLQPVEDAVVPPGHPVSWIEVGSSLQLVAPAAGPHLLTSLTSATTAEGAASKLPDSKTRDIGPRFQVDCTLTSPWLADNERNLAPQPEVEKTSLSANALFRGQRITRATEVDLHAPADLTYDWRPLPARASIAVRASEPIHAQFGDGNGSVVIVLDASGSMGAAANQPFTPQTKYAEATRALRTVLGKLPRGTTISLWVFGQAVGSGKTVAEPETTIRQIQSPMRWDGTAAGADAIMSRVDYPAIEPWNESPIMAALLAAKADLAGATGFKTILLITDGMDNRFAVDKKLNPHGWDVPTALREAFDSTEIVINVVGFKLVPAEAKVAQSQFQAIEKLSPPGKFYTVNEDQGLVATLEMGLRQRLRYWIEDYDHRLAAGVPMSGLDVSRTGANDQWVPGGLAPGGYSLEIHTDRLLSEGLLLNRGDLLLAELVRRGDSIQFQRVLFSAADYPWKPARIQAGWRFSALQNQLIGGQSLQMLIGLEKLPDPTETILAQPRPRQFWLEAAPRMKNAPPVALRWREQAGYPAPTWTIEAARWPISPETALAASPRVRVWWNPDQSTPVVTNLDRGPDFKNIADLAGQIVTVRDETIRLESVQIEEHFVETGPGRRQRESCLVVRAQYDLGKPVWVQVDGLALQGSEHRYFSQVGKYTGLFWPVSPEQIEQTLRSLRIYSQGDFKQDAQRRGFYLDVDDLPPPQSTDLAPRPLMNSE